MVAAGTLLNCLLLQMRKRRPSWNQVENMESAQAGLSQQGKGMVCPRGHWIETGGPREPGMEGRIDLSMWGGGYSLQGNVKL